MSLPFMTAHLKYSLKNPVDLTCITHLLPETDGGACDRTESLALPSKHMNLKEGRSCYWSLIKNTQNRTATRTEKGKTCSHQNEGETLGKQASINNSLLTDLSNSLALFLLCPFHWPSPETSITILFPVKLFTTTFYCWNNIYHPPAVPPHLSTHSGRPSIFLVSQNSRPFQTASLFLFLLTFYHFIHSIHLLKLYNGVELALWCNGLSHCLQHQIPMWVPVPISGYSTSLLAPCQHAQDDYALALATHMKTKVEF